MWKISYFSNKIKSPEGVIFLDDEIPELYDAFINWRDVEGNTPEAMAYFPEEEEEYEAAQKEIKILTEVSRYDQRTTFGKDLYYKTMATIRYEQQHTEITLSDFESIQSDLYDMSVWLFRGQIDKALVVFMQSSFSQVFVDRYFQGIKEKLEAYIAESYVSVDFAKEGDDIIGTRPGDR